MSKKPRILVVEDEEALAIGLQHALVREGYEVVLARDGAAAQQALRDASHDLVLLDVMLPRKSGFEVLAQLRREGRSVPVVMLTSKNEEIDKVHGLDLGADDYMTKPFSLAELLARVRARLRRGAAREEDVVELQLGPARIDLRAMRVELDGRMEELSLREVVVARTRASRGARTLPRGGLGPRALPHHAHRRPAHGQVAPEGRARSCRSQAPLDRLRGRVPAGAVSREPGAAALESPRRAGPRFDKL
jgi:two-component system response regulator RegX3